MGRLIETVEFQFSSMMNINHLHEKISFKKPPYILSRINEKCTKIKIKVVFRPWTKMSPQTFNHELKFEGDKSQSSYKFTISKDMFMRQMIHLTHRRQEPQEQYLYTKQKIHKRVLKSISKQVATFLVNITIKRLVPGQYSMAQQMKSSQQNAQSSKRVCQRKVLR